MAVDGTARPKQYPPPREGARQAPLVASQRHRLKVPGEFDGKLDLESYYR